MSQTQRALAMLALSLALVAATTAVAAAATPPTPIQDPHDRLLRNQQAAQADRTQAAVALARSMERSFKLTAAASPARIEDQHDRWLRNQQDGQAERTTAAVALARSMERTLTPGPATPVVAAQPGPAVPDAGVDVTATVLLGLVSGLVGGVAAIGGWILATRRHRPRPVPVN
jgi:hypothetical protein